MKYFLDWTLSQSTDGVAYGKPFPATVPGDIQLDYAKANGFDNDWYYSDNFHKFDGLEDCYWKYSAIIPSITEKEGEVTYFVSEGIDYQFDVLLNGKIIYSYEGMFTKVQIPLNLSETENLLEVVVYPAPKHSLEDIKDGDDRSPMPRSEADLSAKPAVCYGWDFHPRLIVQGIWDETYIETLSSVNILNVDVNYEITEIFDRKGNADIEFILNVANPNNADYSIEYALTDPDGKTVAKSLDGKMNTTVNLWYPHNKGDQPLYTYTVTLKDKKGNVLDTLSKKIGFRKVELLMNEGTWDYPKNYPMTRSYCPFTLTVNGERLFAKGSNFVNPDIFMGRITKDDYFKQLKLVKDCNMNIIRLWGGAYVNKQCFFDLCDEMGIMVWQEFPLACNVYADDKHYLQTIENEATSIIKKLKRHPSHVIWCGGNELFNSWSKMTDQSRVLRTLNKLCLELDPFTPFLPTSPVMGVSHGPYWFLIKGKDVFNIFTHTKSTGYTEFAVNSLANIEEFEKYIPKDEINTFANTKSWRAHCAFKYNDSDVGHAEVETIERYFGETTDTKRYVKYSQFLSCVGYTQIFEEARRQAPFCSMAINWCFNEPWYCASNCSLVSYGNAIKPDYYAVKNALEPVTPSLRLKNFSYKVNDTLEYQVFILNDSGKKTDPCDVEVFLEYGKTELIKVFHSSGFDKNEYLGKGKLVITEELKKAKGLFPEISNTMINITLKTKYAVKKYPICIE